MKIKKKIKKLISNYDNEIKVKIEHLDHISYNYNHYEPKYGPKENLEQDINATYRVINTLVMVKSDLECLLK